MTDDNSNLVDIDDLDALSTAMEGGTASEVVSIPKEVTDTGSDAPATDEATDADVESDEDLEAEEDSTEPEAEPEDKAKGKKSKFQERIDELTRFGRENERKALAAERQAQELARRLEAIEAREREVLQKEPVRQHLPQGAPDPEAVNEKGELIYPLGKYDPDFIRDVTLYSVDQKIQAKEEERKQQYIAAQIAQAQQALAQDWGQRLAEKEKEVPEIRENIQNLVGTFQNLDPAYGEYLAMSVMQSDYGPEIMEYLSQNIGEAQKIVASGPAAATLHLGRLEAYFASAKARPVEEDKRNENLVSNAPLPPGQVTRGRKGQSTVRGDTKDLTAFEREFYQL